MRPPAVHAIEQDGQRRTADVVEVGVDAGGAERRQASVDIFRPVVDGPVEPELFREPAALGGAAGDADHATLGDLADLRRDGPRRAGRPGDHDGLARLRPGDVTHAEVRGEPGAAEDAQVRRQRVDRLERRQGSRPPTVAQVVVLPAEEAGNEVPGPEVVVAGLDDLSQGGRRHHGAERESAACSRGPSVIQPRIAGIDGKRRACAPGPGRPPRAGAASPGARSSTPPPCRAAATREAIADSYPWSSVCPARLRRGAPEL